MKKISESQAEVIRKKRERENTLITLKAYWDAFPELRLCQLLWNAFPKNVDPFYVTDDDLCKYLEDFATYQSEIK